MDDWRASELKRPPPPGNVPVPNPLLGVEETAPFAVAADGRACVCCGLRGCDPISLSQTGLFSLSLSAFRLAARLRDLRGASGPASVARFLYTEETPLPDGDKYDDDDDDDDDASQIHAKQMIWCSR